LDTKRAATCLGSLSFGFVTGETCGDDQFDDLLKSKSGEIAYSPLSAYIRNKRIFIRLQFPFAEVSRIDFPR
jgi:hypothetical protein